MNLTVEQGNTCLKGGVFDSGGSLVESVVCKGEQMEGLEELAERYGPEAAMVSSVTGGEAQVMARLSGKVRGRIALLESRTEVPLEVRYVPRESLGRDRLAAAVGASCEYRGCDVLIIDAGTAMTFEMVEASGVYIGGAISPGLTTRFRALHAFTKQLPLIDEGSEELRAGESGQSTVASIRAGVVNGMVYEIMGYMGRMWARYPEGIVVLTGGHAQFLEGLVKKALCDGKGAEKGCTFADGGRFVVDGHLVLKGLNRILEYTVC
ncbi:MAG: type III pantothenate kinase [Tannerellaceae bacterium]|nr:type III pantothenate kinase [Tannerellaceae bacterium]